MQIPHLNLVLAWLGILLGFISGLYLGLNFQRDDWLGGYGSFKRRLYRLGHISFFGLAAINFMFYFTVRASAASGSTVVAASAAFVVGAVSMPLCCLLMAHFPRTHLLFGVPVTSLILGAALTVLILCGATPSPVASAALDSLLTQNPLPMTDYQSVATNHP